MKYVPLLNLLLLYFIPALVRHEKQNTRLVFYIKRICEKLNISCELKD